MRGNWLLIAAICLWVIAVVAFAGASVVTVDKGREG